MNKLHLNHVKENSISLENYKMNDFTFECLIFDTESCTNEYIDVDNATADEIASKGARVYGWGLGCTRSEKMIYGQDLKEFINLMPKLFDKYFNLFENKSQKKSKKGYPSHKYVKIPMAIHNLAWDIEFFKYSLSELGFNYRMGEVQNIYTKGNNYQSCVDVEEEKTYHIIQADNVVYGCNIYFPFTHELKNKDGSITKVGLCLDIFDSFKIITTSESNFDQYVTGIDEMFYKMGEEYDYKSFRPVGHKQNDLELCYQYNDIYMLRAVIEQFYIDGLCGGVMPKVGNRTASSIAFKKLKEMTFGEEKTEQQYINYFEIDRFTTFEGTRKRIEIASYGGGFTHASNLYVNKHMKRNGCSLDINSSYPSQMAYKVFPYGKPTLGEYGVIPEIDKDNQVFLIEVGFDFVKPKTDKDKLSIFKIGASNSIALKPLVGNVSGQEYFMTNILDNKAIPVFKELDGSLLKSNYKVVLTNVELEFWLKHYDFGNFTLDEFGCIEEEKELNFDGLEIGEVLIYKAEKGKFREFVEYFTEMKVSNKKKGNIPLTNQAKLFLNSAYGKFGTKQAKTEKDLILDKNGLYTFTSDNEINYEGKEFYRPYASFVTAYGRLQLWNVIINAVGVENFIYCDTDSIYAFRDENSLVQDMEKIGQKVDKTILGMWDVETHFDEFKVLGQKKYMYNNIDLNKDGTPKGINLKCCGLPSDARKIIASQGFNEFYLGKEVEGKLQKRKVVGGCLLLDTKFKIKKIMW